MSIPSSTLHDSTSAWIVGIDLAWGDKREDGLCLIHADRDGAKVLEVAASKGDDALLNWLQQHIPSSDCALLAIDAPLVAPNANGSRPVDKQITLDFGKYHAGCYPANSTKCVRPLRIAQLLRDNGYVVGHDLDSASKMAAEVYPHPAMIRLFYLDRIIKYKKGAITEKKREFKRLQDLVRSSLHNHRIDIEASYDVESLLNTEWNKTVEDKTDALVCALIGYLHWKNQGQFSKIIGSIEEGFILLPPTYRNGMILMESGPGGQVVNMELINSLRDED